VYHYRKSYSCREKGFFREPKIVLTAKTPFAVSLKKLTSNTQLTTKMALPRAAHGKVVFCRERLTAKRYFAVSLSSGLRQNELCINSNQIFEEAN
jgi:hypothetical protein